MTTTDSLIKHYIEEQDDEGNKVMVPVRFMSPEEIEEREALNIANTASALRARVVAQLSGQNGHNGSGAIST